MKKENLVLVCDILEEEIVLKDTGIFKKKISQHKVLKQTGKLKKVEGG